MELKLRKGEVLTVREEEGPCRLTCLEGRLWITARDDDRDYFLNADGRQSGSWFGGMVVEAWEDAVVVLHRGKNPERPLALHLQVQSVA